MAFTAFLTFLYVGKCTTTLAKCFGKPKSEKKRFIYREKPQKYFFWQEYYNKISVLYFYSKNQIPADFLQNNLILQNNNRENPSPSRVFRSRLVDSTPSQLKLYFLLRSAV